MADLTEKSSRTPISDRVYNHIKSNIANGSWKPGDKIPSENILCKTLDVSRVSARAAIRKLTNMGILESYQGRGTFVCADAASINTSDIYPTAPAGSLDRVNLLEYRRMTETASAGYAAMRASTEMIDKLYLTVVNMKLAKTNDQIIKYDLEFHHLIALATANPIILRTFELLQDMFVNVFGNNVVHTNLQRAEDHLKIINAIELRDREAAEAAMLQHLNDSASYMARTLMMSTEQIKSNEAAIEEFNTDEKE